MDPLLYEQAPPPALERFGAHGPVQQGGLDELRDPSGSAAGVIHLARQVVVQVTAGPRRKVWVWLGSDAGRQSLPKITDL
jgi:hypothetical protein